MYFREEYYCGVCRLLPNIRQKTRSTKPMSTVILHRISQNQLADETNIF